MPNNIRCAIVRSRFRDRPSVCDGNRNGPLRGTVKFTEVDLLSAAPDRKAALKRKMAVISN